ncbi:hypothetical protein RA267_28180, partial [Pseudomonas syringae pv. tagetis]|uniref:hypothetical protein n=1 Tax=Pseudomonas syringae group genomosp. 7 TaxID=251699 RepID=UPI0037706552
PNRYGAMLEIPSAINEVEQRISSASSNLVIRLNDHYSYPLGQHRETDAIKMNPAMIPLIKQAIQDIKASCENLLEGNHSSKNLDKVYQETVD